MKNMRKVLSEVVSLTYGFNISVFTSEKLIP